MIAYAMMTGNYLQMEETGEETDAVTRCVSALWDAAQDGTVGGALAECRDLGDHPQTYGHYPWGQGAALLALSLSRRLQTR